MDSLDLGAPGHGFPYFIAILSERSMESMIWDLQIKGIRDLGLPDQLGPPDQGNP